MPSVRRNHRHSYSPRRMKVSLPGIGQSATPNKAGKRWVSSKCASACGHILRWDPPMVTELGIVQANELGAVGGAEPPTA